MIEQSVSAFQAELLQLNVLRPYPCRLLVSGKASLGAQPLDAGEAGIRRDRGYGG